MLAGLGLDGIHAHRAARHPRHQDRRRPPGRARMVWQFRGHQRRQHSQGPVHIVPLGRGHGGDMGRRPGAARRSGDRAGSEGAGTGHDPGPDRQHQSRAAVGAQLRGLRRRSVSFRAAGCGLHQGCAGRRRDPLGEALRRQQRRIRASPHRRTHRRAHFARDLSARLQSRRAGSGRVERHVGLPEGERHLLRREQLPPDRHSEKGVRLQGLRDFRLGQHLFDRAHRECGHGPRDARRPAGEGHAVEPSNHHERQQRDLAGGRQGAGRGQGRTYLRGHTRRQRQPHSARDLSERDLRPSPHRRRRVGYARAARRCTEGSHGGHRAAEECRRTAAPRCREDQVDRGDRTQCRGGAHRWRRQFPGAAQIFDCAARRNQGEGRRRNQGDVRAGRRHGGRGPNSGHS